MEFPPFGEWTQDMRQKTPWLSQHSVLSREAVKNKLFDAQNPSLILAQLHA